MEAAVDRKIAIDQLEARADALLAIMGDEDQAGPSQAEGQGELDRVKSLEKELSKMRSLLWGESQYESTDQEPRSRGKKRRFAQEGADSVHPDDFSEDNDQPQGWQHVSWKMSETFTSLHDSLGRTGHNLADSGSLYCDFENGFLKRRVKFERNFESEPEVFVTHAAKPQEPIVPGTPQVLQTDEFGFYVTCVEDANYEGMSASPTYLVWIAVEYLRGAHPFP